MAWKVIDKTSGNVFVSKSGNTFDDLNDEEKSLFVAAHNQAGDLDKYEIVQQTEEPRRTKYQERKDYFGGGVSGALAEMFPNLAEQQMRGNKVEFNLGRNNAGKNFDMVRAGVADVFSLPGRFFSSLANKSNLIGGSGEFNLGQRSGEEGGNIFGNIARDPITGATIGSGSALANGVRYGAEAGANLGKVGRYAGAALTGAAEGAGIEAASSVLNDRELTGKDLAIGAGLGAGFEAAGTLVQQIMKKYGENLVNASIAALLKGNTKANVTQAEREAFLADPRNRDALMQVLEQQTSGRNAFPFIGGSDRGKTLQKNVDNALDDAKSTINREPMLNDGESALELYQNKTVYKPGERRVEDLNYPHEPPAESRNFRSTAGKEKNGLTKDFKYQSKAEYDLEKFADKYASVSDSFGKFGSNTGPMTKDEMEFLDFLNGELKKDSDVIAGYNPEYVLSSNKFLGDRMPFSSAELGRRIDALQAAHSKDGVSKEFLDEVRRIGNYATLGIGQKAANMINEAFEGKWNELERAFAYTDPLKDAPIYVRKGVRDAMDKFADALDEEAKKSVGVYRKNSNGELYGVSKDKSKKYYYQYLARLQETLANVKNNRHLTAESLAGLYSDATLHNDKAVQDAIIGLMEEMGISKEAVQAFKAKAGNYSMLHKAREAMKKPVKDETFKNSALNAVVPNEGFNFKNSLGFNLQGKNVLNGTNDPTKVGMFARDMFNLGLPYGVDFLNGDK